MSRQFFKLRTANALVVKPFVSERAWTGIRTAASKLSKAPSRNLLAQAGEILGGKFDPDRYLLTHSTIVCSVDTEDVPNVKLGNINDGEQSINRKWANYYVTPDTAHFVNNNCFPPGTPVTLADGTVRPIEEIQVGDSVVTHKGRFRKVTKVYENQFEGNLISIQADGNGERLMLTPEHPVYVRQGDVYNFVAAQKVVCGSYLVSPIFEGRTVPKQYQVLDSNLLFRVSVIGHDQYNGPVYNLEVEEDHTYLAQGYSVHNCDAWERRLLLATYKTFIGGHNFCFAPGTKVLLSDGTYANIEAVSVGAEVVTHTNSIHKVSHVFERDYQGSAYQLYFGASTTPIVATGNHPFRVGEGWVSAEELVVGTYVSRVGANPVSLTSKVAVPYSGKVYNLEVEQDHSYVVDGGVAVHNCEHVQVESLSKGRIIDAVARDVGNSIYIDILTATDHKHKDLVADIQSGKMGTLSMGCQIDFSQCTKCGNVARDETEMCSHIKYEKGNTFIDKRGQKRVIAELCGHYTEPKSVRFIEASWVKSPAFQGAVLRNILSPSEVSRVTQRKAMEVLSSPPKQWIDDESMPKAASTRKRFVRGFDFNDMGDGGGDSGGGESKPKPPEVSPLDEVEKSVKKHVLDRVKRDIQKDLDSEDSTPEPTQSVDHPNDSIVKQGTTRQSYVDVARKVFAKTATSDVEFLSRVADLDASMNRPLPNDLYRVAANLGAIEIFGTPVEYVLACQASLGRDLSRSEAVEVVKLGKLLSIVASNRTNRGTIKSLKTGE